MGFYNMANGVPIASWADRGTLNARLPSVFPMERWGRRAPWLVMGLPLNSLAAIMVLFPPFPLGSEWLAAWYGLTLRVYFTGHTATTQQFYAIPQELCGSKKEVATLQDVAEEKERDLQAQTLLIAKLSRQVRAAHVALAAAVAQPR